MVEKETSGKAISEKVNSENVIDAWGSNEISADEKLFKNFGLKKIFPHESFDNYLFDRGIIIAHRDLEPIAESISKKRPFIQLTGIASSGELHFGHKLDIDLFKFFASKKSHSFFALSDIDAYVSRDDSKVPSMAKAKEYACSIAGDLLAMGLREEQIYVQSRKEQRYYEFAFEVSKKMTEGTFEAIYGHTNLGKVAANLLQYSDILHQQLPEFNGPMNSVTGIGLDQDPHARAVRDIAKRLPYGLKPPGFVYFKHQRGLSEGKKMSASEPDTAIFLADSPADVKKKINKSFSGGRNTLEEHRKLGAIVENDRAFEMLFFHNPNTKEVEKIRSEYASGKMLSGEMKQIAIEFVNGFLKEHQEKKKQFAEKARKIVYGK